MGGDEVAEEQARLLCEALGRAGVEVKQLWFRYFTLGGYAREIEIDAYLHHCLTLPALQRDLLAHAANELIAQPPPLRAPYVSDLLKDSGPEAEE